MYTKLVEEYRFNPTENKPKYQGKEVGRDSMRFSKNMLLDLVYYGYICIMDEYSKVIYQAGDSDDLIFYRSASKPIQALPVFKYGLDKAYGIEERGSEYYC